MQRAVRNGSNFVSEFYAVSRTILAELVITLLSHVHASSDHMQLSTTCPRSKCNMHPVMPLRASAHGPWQGKTQVSIAFQA